MLNRRHALIAASGLAATGTSQLLDISVGHARPRPEPAADDATHPTQAMTAAAESCLVCVSDCDRVLASDVIDDSLRRLITDCRDICTVTATLLARQAPMSPAICQACQDACERLAAATTVARVAARNCAVACRGVLNSHSEDSPQVVVLAN